MRRSNSTINFVLLSPSQACVAHRLIVPKSNDCSHSWRSKFCYQTFTAVSHVWCSILTSQQSIARIRVFSQREVLQTYFAYWLFCNLSFCWLRRRQNISLFFKLMVSISIARQINLGWDFLWHCDATFKYRGKSVFFTWILYLVFPSKCQIFSKVKN